MKLSKLIRTAYFSWAVLCQAGMVAVCLVVLGEIGVAAEPPHAGVNDEILASSPAWQAIPRSVFDADSPTGRDPFFPQSARHSGREKRQQGDPIELSSSDEVRLNGLSGTTDNRLAIINHRTFAVGENGVIRVNGKPIAVRVEAIREASAVVIINGTSRELHLRDGL